MDNDPEELLQRSNPLYSDEVHRKYIEHKANPRSVEMPDPVAKWQEFRRPDDSPTIPAAARRARWRYVDPSGETKSEGRWPPTPRNNKWTNDNASSAEDASHKPGLGQAQLPRSSGPGPSPSRVSSRSRISNRRRLSPELPSRNKMPPPPTSTVRRQSMFTRSSAASSASAMARASTVPSTVSKIPILKLQRPDDLAPGEIPRSASLTRVEASTRAPEIDKAIRERGTRDQARAAASEELQEKLQLDAASGYRASVDALREKEVQPNQGTPSKAWAQEIRQLEIDMKDEYKSFPGGGTSAPIGPRQTRQQLRKRQGHDS